MSFRCVCRDLPLTLTVAEQFCCCVTPWSQISQPLATAASPGPTPPRDVVRVGQEFDGHSRSKDTVGRALPGAAVGGHKGGHPGESDGLDTHSSIARSQPHAASPALVERGGSDGWWTPKAGRAPGGGSGATRARRYPSETGRVAKSRTGHREGIGVGVMEGCARDTRNNNRPLWSLL